MKQSSKSLNLKVRDDAKISENESPSPVNRKAREAVPGLDFHTCKVGDPIPGIPVGLEGDEDARITEPFKGGKTNLPGISDRWGDSLDYPTRKVGDPIPGVGVPLDGDASRRIT